MVRRRAIAALAVGAGVVLAGAPGCGRHSVAPTAGVDAPPADTTTSTHLARTFEPGPADCTGIEAFAGHLTSSTPAIDYQLSASPAELAAQSDLVVRGHLTGTAREVRGELTTYVAHEVAVDEVVVGTAVAPGDLMTVHWYAGTPGPAARRPQPIPVPVGAPVAVFASWYDDADGWFAMVEGFTLSCPAGQRLGLTGFLPGWQGLRTVDDVIAAAPARSGSR